MALQRSAAKMGTDGRSDQASRLDASGVERVRAALATRLHDGPIQTLTAASLRVGLLRREVPDEFRGRVAEVEELLATSITALRAEMNELRPPAELADHLADALAGLLRRHDVVDRVTITADGDLLTTDPVALAAYRAVQAVIRTTPAMSGTIRIEVGPAGSARVTIPVADHDLVEEIANSASGAGHPVVDRSADGASVTIASRGADA